MAKEPPYHILLRAYKLHKEIVDIWLLKNNGGITSGLMHGHFLSKDAYDLVEFFEEHGILVKEELSPILFPRDSTGYPISSPIGKVVP